MQLTYFGSFVDDMTSFFFGVIGQLLSWLISLFLGLFDWLFGLFSIDFTPVGSVIHNLSTFIGNLPTWFLYVIGASPALFNLFIAMVVALIFAKPLFAMFKWLFELAVKLGHILVTAITSLIP